MNGLAKLGELWHSVQAYRFPGLEDGLGELDEKHREFVAVCEACAPHEHMAGYLRGGNGCPPKDRLALCKAFTAKAVWDFIRPRPGRHAETRRGWGFCKRLSYCHNHRSPAGPRRRWGRLTPYLFCSILHSYKEMPMLATVTSKGQVTLPVELRRRFHLETGARVDFVVRDDGRIELVPTSGSMKRLKGMLPKPNNYVSLADMERGIRQGGGAMP